MIMFDISEFGITKGKEEMVVNTVSKTKNKSVINKQLHKKIYMNVMSMDNVFLHF